MNNFIQELIKSKIIIIFAAFGAVLSLILGIFSQVNILMIILRCLIGALIMGIMGLVLQFFLKRNLSEEDYSSLFRLNGKKQAADEPVFKEKPKTEKAPGIDMTEDSGMAPEDIYSGAGEPQDGGLERHDLPDDLPPAAEKEATVRRETDYTPDPGADAGGGFQEMRFGGTGQQDYPGRDESVTPSYAAERETTEQGPAPRNISKFKEEMKVMKDAGAKEGELKLKVGKKIINTETKVVANAIKTILKRD